MGNLERGSIVAGALVVAGAGWSYLVFADASMASAMFGMPGMGAGAPSTISSPSSCGWR